MFLPDHWVKDAVGLYAAYTTVKVAGFAFFSIAGPAIRDSTMRHAAVARLRPLRWLLTLVIKSSLLGIVVTSVIALGLGTHWAWLLVAMSVGMLAGLLAKRRLAE